MRDLLNRLRPERGCRFDVLGLGGCSLDELWRLSDDATAAPGAVLSARARDQLGGGAVATTLVAARRLGLRAGLCSAVGADEPGRTVVQGLRDEGVDTGAVRVLGQARTRCTLTLAHGDGRRTTVEVRDPALTLPETSPAERDILQSRVVHLDLSFPAAADRAARLARQHRVLLSLSLTQDRDGAAQPQVASEASGATPPAGVLAPSARSPLSGQASLATPHHVDVLLSLADLCILDGGFAQHHTGVASFERALLSLSRRTSALVVATLGDRGCVAVDREESGERLIYCPAFPVVPGADRTGCGDTFRAALLTYLLRSAAASPRPLEDAMRFANAAAALKCRALGRRGCPTWREVEQLVNAGLGV